MPIHANMYGGPAVHPPRSWPRTPDTPDSALEQNHGWRWQAGRYLPRFSAHEMQDTEAYRAESWAQDMRTSSTGRHCVHVANA